MPISVPPPRWSLAALLGEAVAYGMNTVLFGFAVFFLLTRRARTKGTAALGATTLLMFALATAHFALTAYYTFATLPIGRPAGAFGVMGRPLGMQIYAPIVLQIINSLLGDLVVVWRVWVLWDQRSSMLVIPSCLFLVALTSSVFATMTAMADPPAIADNAILWTALFTGSAILINVWAVVSIGIRYAMYRKDVLSVLGRQDAMCRSILVLLVESGGLYCCTLIIYAAVSLSGSSGECIVLSIMAQLTAIYPTLIIVLVCLKLTQRDDMDDFNYAIRSLGPLSGFMSETASYTSGARSHDTPASSVFNVDKDFDLEGAVHITPPQPCGVYNAQRPRG